LPVTDDDLRAAVAAGILTEAQASRALTLAQTRAGTRAALTGDDEPFELFRGFAEVFISVGLILLVGGFISLAEFAGSGPLVPVIGAGLCVGLALYFTRRRRMTLPSIVLVSGFALSLTALSAAIIEVAAPGADWRAWAIGGALVQIGLLLLWFRVFRVPFTMFLVGLTTLAMILFLSMRVSPVFLLDNPAAAFDLRERSGLALGTLGFGIGAFLIGMWFDLRDPNRLGRMAATGFWLHLLAAPAIVNTIALTLFNMGTTTGYALTGVALLVVTLLALLIDRRSFLTAGIAYFGALIYLALDGTTDGGAGPVTLMLLILGGFITLIGAFWSQTRGAILRGLPEFPGKGRLPPYQ
jgi:hypothetical protein